MQKTEAPETSEQTQRPRGVVLLLWRALALVSFALGVVGAFLPVLPTVPFLLLSAWAASRGWTQFEDWLVRHPRFGPPIVRWRQRGAVSRGAKWLACATMAVSAGALQFVPRAPLPVRIGVPLFLLGMAIWLWRRPEE